MVQPRLAATSCCVVTGLPPSVLLVQIPLEIGNVGLDRMGVGVQSVGVE